MRKVSITLAAAALAAAAHAGPAAASTFICVPTAAGQAVTSGGSGGSCGTATPVELPDSRAQQQTLLSVLPYLSFKTSGIGAKPTIVVTGANVQIKKTSASVIKDGTGNLVVGDGAQYPVASTHSGSENLVVGYDDEWTGNSDAIVGQFHKVSGYSDLVAGRQNTVSGSHSVISGLGNTITGSDSTLMGGSWRTAGASGANLGDGKNGEGPTYFAVLDANGQITSQSAGSKFQTYDYDGYTWLYLPGGKLAKCSATATPRTYDPSAHVTQYDAGYDEWLLFYTYKGTAAGNFPINVTVECP